MPFQKITQIDGFNNMATDTEQILPNREIFLLRPDGTYVSLGSFAQAAARAGAENNQIVGVDGIVLGSFGTPQIDNNLFVVALPSRPIRRPMSSAPAGPIEGGRSRRSRKSRYSRKSRRSRKHRAKMSRRSKKR